MNKIVDGFLFYNEVDLLEMRLEELYPVVDEFLIVQADKTFRGEDKPSYFDCIDPRWDKYMDKIKWTTVVIPDNLTTPWDREKYQRDTISDDMSIFCKKNDICIISDVDEIPRREIIEQIREQRATDFLMDGPRGLEMDLYYYSLNAYAGEWGAARVLRARHLTTAEEIRHSDVDLIPFGGWHFSYLGDDAFISNKLKSFSHSELDTPEVHNSVGQNRAMLRDPFNHQQQLEIHDLAWLPYAVKNNPKKWSKYLWQKSD